MSLLQPGQIFAQRYRVECYLAEGGMGAVFVGQQLATDQPVAVKVLWPGTLRSGKAIERFELEAKVAGRVQSENIVRVLDAGFDQQTQFPFLVMELLRGQTLEDLVETEGPLGSEQVVEYLTQTARGLDKAHGYVTPEGAPAPVVHRDLKPENLFLTHRDNGDPLVKILDFGIAKTLSETASVSQELRGTPLYMAFEQAVGERITPQTDVWALGLIAFFLLTGKCYWKTASNPDAGIQALITEVLTYPKPAASARAMELTGTSLGPGFDAWLARCLARDPSERFASAGETVHQLSQVLSPDQSKGAVLPVSFAATDVAHDPAVVLASSIGSTVERTALSHTRHTEIPKRSLAVPVLVAGGVLAAAVVGVVVWVGSGTTELGSASAEPSVAVPSAAAARPPSALDEPSARVLPVAPQPSAVPSQAEPPPPSTAKPAQPPQYKPPPLPKPPPESKHLPPAGGSPPPPNPKPPPRQEKRDVFSEQ